MRSSDSIPLRSISEATANFLDDFSLVRKTARLQFRIDLLAVNRDFKTAPGRWLQFEPPKLLFEVRQDLLRQTDGLGLVISSRAIKYMDFHDFRSLCVETLLRETP